MTNALDLQTAVQFLKGVGPARARSLDRLGIATVADLLAHYPRRYFDRTGTQRIGRCRPGQEATVLAEVLTSGERRTRRGGTVQTASLGDDTGVVFCVWFNQRYVLKQFRPGRRVLASGMVQMHGGQRQMPHPDYEFLDESDGDQGAGLHTGRLVPVYPLTAGVGQHWLRGLVHQALQRLGPAVPEVLPAGLLARHGLPGRAAALAGLHFPASAAELDTARRRLVYEEIFAIQVLMALRRESRRQLEGIRLEKPGDLTRKLVEGLPFALTGAQRRVLAEILADLRSGSAMHRLLQGDVGSGKTLVALIAALFAIEQGWQAMLMAPTEVLARQHGQTLRKLAGPLGVTVETLTGSTPAAERRAMLAGAAAGEIDLLVGTHALIQDDVAMPRLALTVVDEQHRFGVRQRSRGAAEKESGRAVHVLVMSATPIPRSLSLTLYGDLDLSVIDELPPGRTPIGTRLVRDTEEGTVWEDLRREIAAGRQAFVIHPVIEETEGQDLKAATAEHERLSRDVFPGRRVALLHGKLKAKEKEAVMDAFAAGLVDVLVATTVVEVGIDVPNASRLVIHNPERFGLAQLHQLRGRVGRGAAASACWLLVDRFLGDEAWQRLVFFSEHGDGFDLAEEDLRRRGPGDAWGVRQHGAPGFRLANPLRDHDLVQECRRDARALLEADPGLTGPDGLVVRAGLEQGFSGVMPLLAG